jgi:hypothetical protein
MDYLNQNRGDIASAVDAGLIDINTGYAKAIADLKPLVDQGLVSLADYNQLLQDPSAIMNRPSTQFQYNQGLSSLQTGFSKSTGGGLSGNIVAAAQQYGQNFASQNLDAELARLSPLISIGANAIGQTSTLNANQGNAAANLRISGTSQMNTNAQLATGAIGNAAATTAASQTANSINQGNTFNSLLSNLSNLAVTKMSY